MEEKRNDSEMLHTALEITEERWELLNREANISLMFCNGDIAMAVNRLADVGVNKIELVCLGMLLASKTQRAKQSTN